VALAVVSVVQFSGCPSAALVRKMTISMSYAGPVSADGVVVAAGDVAAAWPTAADAGCVPAAAGLPVAGAGAAREGVDWGGVAWDGADWAAPL
jgi:hypothetical protein